MLDHGATRFARIDHGPLELLVACFFGGLPKEYEFIQKLLLGHFTTRETYDDHALWRLWVVDRVMVLTVLKQCNSA